MMNWGNVNYSKSPPQRSFSLASTELICSPLLSREVQAKKVLEIPVESGKKGEESYSLLSRLKMITVGNVLFCYYFRVIDYYDVH